MTNIQGDEAQTKRQKMLKKFEKSSTKTVTEQSMSSQTPLGSVIEFAGDLNDNMNMQRMAAKLVPRLLTNDQKQRCKANEDPTFISRIITGDESWIYSYDPETKQQSSQWKSPQLPRAKRKRKARQVRSSTKSMLIVFFDVKGVGRREFVPPNATVNSDFYCDVLRRLRENVRRKKPEIWCNHNRFLHRDMEPAHTSLQTTGFVTNNNMVIVPHSPYSLDLGSCDFALFPKLKMKLKRRHLESV
jgi:histone-lysine N-methyltransferase SETMAR